jgi:hypothetical protein
MTETPSYMFTPEYQAMEKRLAKAMTSREVLQIKNEAGWNNWKALEDDAKWVLCFNFGYKIVDGKLQQPQPELS